jgi:hypothetical protein
MMKKTQATRKGFPSNLVEHIAKPFPLPTLGAAVRVAFAQCYADPVTARDWITEIGTQALRSKPGAQISSNLESKASHKLNTFAVINPFTFPLACVRSLKLMANSVVDRNAGRVNNTAQKIGKGILQAIPIACETILLPLSDLLNKSSRNGELRSDYIFLKVMEDKINRSPTDKISLDIKDIKNGFFKAALQAIDINKTGEVTVDADFIKGYLQKLDTFDKKLENWAKSAFSPSQQHSVANHVDTTISYASAIDHSSIDMAIHSRASQEAVMPLSSSRQNTYASMRDAGIVTPASLTRVSSGEHKATQQAPSQNSQNITKTSATITPKEKAEIEPEARNSGPRGP